MSQDSRPQKQSIAFKVCAVLLALRGGGGMDIQALFINFLGGGGEFKF